ncbi:hydantoinase/oxoprolinase family protein [Marinovum sp. 2_MG-2023]|uniref:hydantoinase/oxoprolinase family protein n=1 Tax=unclassified Marinovum TaxID=2647166 RepID=UPI0026E391F9|nr:MULTISPECIES: hydantoinase/oxoprolinase family protein [unclassified Marinovum]MDO6729046.1 hydantoinase/oxoprolinase family protein [Marinovum sp. 2_MG-2023]MDO6779327.1 hydantoinase/oxoprolinase family protein [Marinovum sp. 1_MG-2023]
MIKFSIDIGGTFTDVVAETETGLTSVKVLTTPASPDRGALDGMGRLLANLGKTYADISAVIHGTTLATNALIERRGARTAFVTTAGFRDVLDMRYEKRFEQYDLNIEMPQSLVARPLRLGIKERILADGSVYQAPQDDEIDALAATLLREKVEAVAIGFLHSYRNPAHETYVADRLQKTLGDTVTICQSADVACEIREYERFSTVCANAYVRPLMSKYLGALKAELNRLGFDGSFLMMLSGGGLTTLDQAMRFPIRLVESGPAGGVALAAHVAREVGSNKTLSLDIGGTTAKICFICDGNPHTTRRFEVARAWRDVKGSGLPVRVPTVELVEIGAGGGSIAGVDTLGRLKVGPRSAGSDPGPAAYGRGGGDATITDAHLTVGNIAAEGFAGGMISLTPENAPKVIAQHVQGPMGIADVDTAAAGIIELADETMANAARVHGIELGHDIASFDLLVSGGGGALHAARIAEKLGIRRIIVPQNAGVGSAVGFLRSPVAFESALSVMAVLAEVDAPELTQRVVDQLAHVRAIVGEAVPADHIDATVKFELRYQGQGLEVALDYPADSFVIDAAKLEAEFFRRYENLVGFTLKNIPVELVSVSVTAREKRGLDTQDFTLQNANDPVATRQVFDLASQKRLTYQTLKRSSLGPTLTQGPAVVTEDQTTTLVRPGWSVHTSDQGHLILDRSEA